MNRFPLTLVLLLTAIIAHAQSGSIRGKITTSDGQPAGYVSIGITGTRNGTITGENGEFFLQQVKAGPQVLRITGVGLLSLSHALVVKEGQTTELPVLILKENAAQLQEVQITAQHRFTRKENEYVARMPLHNMENPQAYTVISKELMREQVVTDLQGTLVTAPGVSNVVETVGSGGIGLSARLRGFSTGTALRNGMATNFMTLSDPSNLESLEIIKGPSGTLFGASYISYGGLINRITKKPFRGFGGDVTLSGGSWDLGRASLDLNTPLNADSSVLFRITAAAHRQRSFQDFGNQRTLVATPALSYQVNHRLLLSFEAEFFNSNRTSNFYGVSNNIAAKDFKELNPDTRVSYTNNDLKSKASVFNAFARAAYKISSSWTSQTNWSYGSTDNNANYLFLTFLGDSVQRRIMQIPSNFGVTQLQQNFVGDFHIGSLRNRVVAGVDYTHIESRDRRQTVVYDTVRINEQRDISLERYQHLLFVADTSRKTMRRPFTRKQDIYAAYISDVLNVTDQLMLMASLRIDHFSNADYSQTSLSPKFGVVYQPVKNVVSLFANYMNGFQNVAPGTVAENTVQNFKPEQANQWEGGVKVDMWQGKVSGTFSYYDIQVKNVVRQNPDNRLYSIQDGTRQSKGVDAEISAAPVKGLHLIAGYSYNDSRFTKAAKNVEGKRPYSTPLNTANIWASYRLTHGAASGLGIGAGVNYTDVSFINDINSFTVPAYTLVNATVFLDRPRFRAALKVNNLTNQFYWVSDSWAQPQGGRQFTGTVTYKF